MVKKLIIQCWSIVVSHGIAYSTPSNLNYFWEFGSISRILLVWQVLSGILLAMHFSLELSLAFNSIEHIMRDVPNAWLIWYCHSSGASMFFIAVFLSYERLYFFYINWIDINFFSSRLTWKERLFKVFKALIGGLVFYGLFLYTYLVGFFMSLIKKTEYDIILYRILFSPILGLLWLFFKLSSFFKWLKEKF